MFDIGWPELAVILVVALVVIGPKDLPKALHTVGKWVRKARGLAREFQSNVDEMVRHAELEDLRKQVEDARRLNLKDQLETAVDPGGQMRSALTMDDPLAMPPAAQPAATRPAAPTEPAATPPVDPVQAKASTEPAATEPVATERRG